MSVCLFMDIYVLASFVYFCSKMPVILRQQLCVFQPQLCCSSIKYICFNLLPKIKMLSADTRQIQILEGIYRNWGMYIPQTGIYKYMGVWYTQIEIYRDGEVMIQGCVYVYVVARDSYVLHIIHSLTSHSNNHNILRTTTKLSHMQQQIQHLCYMPPQEIQSL